MRIPPGDLADSRITRDPHQPTRFHGSLSPSWNILYVFGGATMTTAIQAARCALSQPDFSLLSANATFLSPAQSGDVVLDTRTLRAGKGAEQISVDMAQGEPEKNLLHLVTTFGPARDADSTFTELAFPDVPKASELTSVEARPGSRMAMVPYYHSVEARPVTTDLPNGESGPAEWRGWYRLRQTPRLSSGAIDPASYACAADMIAPALRMARGREAAPILLVSLEISLHVLALTESEWLLQDAHVYHAGNGYVTGVVHVWDEEKKLVAHALQRAVIRPRAF